MDARLHRCNQCTKSCRDIFSLREHVRTHTGERPYKCKYCNKEFKTCGVLRRHERVHGLQLKPLGKIHNRMKAYGCNRTNSITEEVSGAATGNESRDEHQKQSGRYLCLSCDVELASIEDLLQHHSVTHSDRISTIHDSAFDSGDQSETRNDENIGCFAEQLLSQVNETHMQEADGVAKVYENHWLGSSSARTRVKAETVGAGKGFVEADMECITKPLVSETLCCSGVLRLTGSPVGLEVVGVKDENAGVCFPLIQAEDIIEDKADLRYLLKEITMHEDGGIEQGLYDREIMCSQDYRSLASRKSQENLHGSCHMCGKTFANGLRLKVHLKGHLNDRTHSTVKSFHCPDCKRTFSDGHRLRLHMSTAHKPKEEIGHYTCDVCSKSFAYMYRLRRHMLHHTGEKPFRCNDCGKAFTTNVYLKSHMARHSKEWTHLCSVCGKTFADVVAWRTHKRCHEKDSEGRDEHVCWICGRKLTNASNLTKHVQRHADAGEKPYECNECGRRFRTKEGFHYHVGTHAVEKPYRCMECPRTFADVSSLKMHLKFHARHGSFLCNICGRKYKTSSYLKIHSRGHTDQRLSCEVCGETFGYARQLRSHLVKHKAPYKCEKCGVTCKRSNGLRKHQKRFGH